MFLKKFQISSVLVPQGTPIEFYFESTVIAKTIPGNSTTDPREFSAIQRGFPGNESSPPSGIDLEFPESSKPIPLVLPLLPGW
jgi:hypothetical protein